MRIDFLKQLGFNTATAMVLQINSKLMKEEKTAIPLTKEEPLPIEEEIEETQDQLWNDAFNEVSKHAFEHGVRLTMTETAILDNFLDKLKERFTITRK